MRDIIVSVHVQLQDADPRSDDDVAEMVEKALEDGVGRVRLPRGPNDLGHFIVIAGVAGSEMP